MVRALALGLLIALAATPAARAQLPNLNTSRMSRFDPYDAYNDIWGYTAPDGREYAAVGTNLGTMIVNVTDPVEPFEVAFIPGDLCIWRDMKSYGEYLYIVSDCGDGVQVIDMSAPDTPVFANLFGVNEVKTAHNVHIDTQAGVLYAVGTNSGMKLFDLDADPVDPPFITSYGGSYVHDVSVNDGRAFAAQIYAGDLRVLNVSNLPSISTISAVNSGEQFAHATWPNDDNSVVVCADETTGARHLVFFDMSNPNNPTKMGVYSENTILAIPHNPFIKGEVCHASWYTEGYIALDISDPSDPVKLARFDTQPNVDAGGTNGFEGAWGCYPFADTGFIYVSDRKRGLFVVSLNECSAQLPEQAQPQVCKVWPDTVRAMESPRARVVLTGKGFDGATAVTVGGTVMSPAEFEVRADQVILFRMPVVAEPGFNDITVTTPGGTSLVAQIEVTLPEGPVLDTGAAEQIEGGQFTVAMGSQPGDLHFPVIGFTDIPSVVPGKVAFGIGNGFNDLIFLNTLPASNAGVSGFPVVVPPGSLGVTLYWQVAVVTPGQPLPATVTDFTTMTIVDPPVDD